MCNFKKKGISTFSKSIFFILILLFSILISLSAQTIFPTKPVEIIVTFAAGGAVDTSTRVLASEAEKYFGQKILITNKTGGGGTEGIIQVSKAKPDGYQLLALTSAAITNIVTKNVDYQIDSFDPVIMFTYDPATLSVYANGPYANLDEFLNAAKTTKISIATAGHSTANHVACLVLENKYNLNFKYIHTKGVAEVSTMVAGGHVASGVGPWADFRIMTEQRKMKVIGVMADSRDPRLPDVPTFKEKGYNVLGGVWRGIAAPKGTPPEVIRALHDAFKKALDSPELQKRYNELGLPIVYKNSSDFKANIIDSYESYVNILPLLQQ